MTARPGDHTMASEPLAVSARSAAEHIEVMEAVARQMLQTQKGIAEATSWIDGTEGERVLHADITVDCADSLVSVVDYVADELVQNLEHIQKRSFARHDLNFTIADTPSSDLPKAPVLIIT